MNWTDLIKSGSLRDIRKALRENTPDLGHDKYGYTLLHYAVMRDDSSFRIGQWLLDAGADPNATDRARFKQTPLHLAAEKAELELAELLLERGAEPDRPDNWGNGPAWKALHFGGLDINTAKRPRFERFVRLLVEAGADLDRKNEAGKTCRDHFAHGWWGGLADL